MPIKMVITSLIICENKAGKVSEQSQTGKQTLSDPGLDGESVFMLHDKQVRHVIGSFASSENAVGGFMQKSLAG